MNPPLILREGAPARIIDLPDPVAEALNQTCVARCVRTGRADGGRAGVWEVSAGTQVGVAQVAGRQIVIRPKIAMNRLIFLMGYARRPRFWRDDVVDLDAADDLPQALTSAFLRLAAKALDQGLLKGYREVGRRACRCCAGASASPTSCATTGVAPSRWRCATTSSPSTSPRTSCCWPPLSGC